MKQATRGDIRADVMAWAGTLEHDYIHEITLGDVDNLADQLIKILRQEMPGLTKKPVSRPKKVKARQQPPV